MMKYVALCTLAPDIPGHTPPLRPPVQVSGQAPDAQTPGSSIHQRGRLDDVDDFVDQAVRFRVYAYDNGGALLGELNTKNGYNLTWNVHVANKKASGFVFQRKGI